ncbi:hypothetical protein JX265_000073 [Neoarthrinium moseri]|uniref:DUF2828 domain-containing protein n=1 Tax=Neoarthrinium moseri TaxID=1658444 RepID=A0A9P9WY78_9PEZI|nr:hypothetical protein JX266_008113 [Neoarthrinium moseri]KAI1881247.1 hypothetical protein JX265_000073 [Neoarthrinium moseri]
MAPATVPENQSAGAAASCASAAASSPHSSLNSSFPVWMPELPELGLQKSLFKSYICSLVGDRAVESHDLPNAEEPSAPLPTERDETGKASTAPFMDALLGSKLAVPTFDERDSKMLTENGDVAYSTSGDVLVDLFYELETLVSTDRLKVTLEAAWNKDPDSTLRLIWNARSIHLGKSDKITFYRAAGWLAQHHPQTFLSNIEWLVRPVIRKKVPTTDSAVQSAEAASSSNANISEVCDSMEDFDIVSVNSNAEDGQSPTKIRKTTVDVDLPHFEVKHGVSHGYWKDLLNMLALAANGKLNADLTPNDIHCILNDDACNNKGKSKRDWSQGRKKSLLKQRHDNTVTRLQEDSFYRAFFMAVARIFADQLALDMSCISNSKCENKEVSLCAKWAPTPKHAHDRHTFIASSIAELLFPFDTVCPESVDPTDRTTYLKYARRAYQCSTLSKLRRHLEVVERPISEECFDHIRYDRIPSLAMKQYTSLFIKKDKDGFAKYIEKVASGKSRISGATLLPSTLIHGVRSVGHSNVSGSVGRVTSSRFKAQRDPLTQEILDKTADGQWRTLCQRIRDSGKLESSIAVCDVSGSMLHPKFRDGTCPMDSSIGLSLLMAEITQPPFGGAFITFSDYPQVMHVGGTSDKRSLREKVDYIAQSAWSMSTNFVSVFEDLLLPMAVEHGLKPEDMVKQVFVFSDMQFNQADVGQPYEAYRRPQDTASCWSSSFERIKKKFQDAGYEMPRLIFWNLAGGRNNRVASKPVTADEENVALVSGYSQGQLKMFLENGQFEDDPDEVVESEHGDEVIVQKQKNKLDPSAAMRKAISHDAYRILEVID